MSPNDSSNRPARALLRRVTGLGLVAIVVNLLVLVLGRAAGASFELPGFAADAPIQVTVTSVLLATVASLTLGTAAAAFLLMRHGARSVRALQVVGGVLALLSVISPAVASTDSTTKVALTAMHLITGAAYVIALQPVAQSPARQRVKNAS